MKRLSLLLILFVSLSKTYACDYEDMSFLWWYFKSDMICTGEVIQVFESDSASYDVRLLIDRVYKGDNLDTIRFTVNSYPEGGKVMSDCDVYMKKGDKYLVYAWKSGSRYFTGGQESRTNRLNDIRKFFPQDFIWLESAKYKITKYYWNWHERDVAPFPNELDSIVNNNFDLYSVDLSDIHKKSAHIICNINAKGKLTRANLFSGQKGSKKKIYRKVLDKFEYLNPRISCSTEFQKEAIRVTKLIKEWSPSIFCGERVKGQVLIKYEYEDGKIKIEMIN